MHRNTGRRPRARGEISRQTLLGVATRMFLEKGFANTSVAEIVGEANLPPPSLYYHFGNKQNLLAAVIEARGRWIRDDYIVDPAASVTDNIALLTEHARKHILDHVTGLRLRLILTFENDADLKDLVIAGRKHSVDGLAEKIASIRDLAASNTLATAKRLADAYLVGVQGISLDYMLRARSPQDLKAQFASLAHSLLHTLELDASPGAAAVTRRKR